jgi:hypothetical protein
MKKTHDLILSAKVLANANQNSHDCNLMLAKISYSILNSKIEDLDLEDIKNVSFQSSIKVKYFYFYFCFT